MKQRRVRAIKMTRKPGRAMGSDLRGLKFVCSSNRPAEAFANGRDCSKPREFIILKQYPYFVRCSEIGTGYEEDFTIGDLVMLGIISDRTPNWEVF